MDFLNIKSGEEMEIGTQSGFRFWRYTLSPLRLVSWVSDKQWYPNEPAHGTSPDVGEQGIHAYKTWEDLMFSVCYDPNKLAMRSLMTGCDGVVIGTVSLWGIIWDHTKGFRAQFGKPTSFISSYGRNNKKALVYLRSAFGVEPL